MKDVYVASLVWAVLEWGTVMFAFSGSKYSKNEPVSRRHRTYLFVLFTTLGNLFTLSMLYHPDTTYTEGEILHVNIIATFTLGITMFLRDLYAIIVLIKTKGPTFACKYLGKVLTLEISSVYHMLKGVRFWILAFGIYREWMDLVRFRKFLLLYHNGYANHSQRLKMETSIDHGRVEWEISFVVQLPTGNHRVTLNQTTGKYICDRYLYDEYKRYTEGEIIPRRKMVYLPDEANEVDYRNYKGKPCYCFPTTDERWPVDEILLNADAERELIVCRETYGARRLKRIRVTFGDPENVSKNIMNLVSCETAGA